VSVTYKWPVCISEKHIFGGIFADSKSSDIHSWLIPLLVLNLWSNCWPACKAIRDIHEKICDACYSLHLPGWI